MKKTTQQVKEAFSTVYKRIWPKMKHQVRPSPGEVKIFERLFKKILKERGKLKVLILGMTPELRDIALKNRVNLTSVDISLEMIIATQDLISFPNEKETLIRDNWLTVPLAENYYDLAFADTAINMLGLQEWEKFLGKMKKHLKSDGYFLQRVVILPKDFKGCSYKEALERYRKEKDKAQALYYNVLAGLNDPDVWDKKSGKYITGEVSRKFMKLLKKGEMTEEEFKAIKSPNDKMVLIWPSEEFFLNLLKKHFSLITREVASDFKLCPTDPIYLAQVRA
jgi:hypothetical protein